MLDNLVIVALVTAVVLGRRHMPILAAAFGMSIAVGIGLWGHQTYEAGGYVAIAATPLDRSLFMVFVALWFLLESANLYREVNKRRRKSP